MKKIPTLYVRTPDRRHVIPDQVTPGCEWVFDLEQDSLVRATRKLDGVCVRYSRGNWWSRRQVKPGRAIPAGFIQIENDPVTGIWTGWEPAIQSAHAKFIHEAIDANRIISADHIGDDETFELVGPKINGNPDHFEHHTLFSHYEPALVVRPWRDADNGAFLVMARALMLGWEGIVWHHADGRMAKLKVKDLPHGVL